MGKQLVIIKTWDKMVEEYGIDKDRMGKTIGIKVPFGFLSFMEHALSPHRIIEVNITITKKNRKTYTCTKTGWSISKEMIEAFLPTGEANGKNKA